MCRLMAYVGQPQLLADIVLYPDRSIIKQSYDARERKIDPTLPFHLGHGNLNGDGFGIGWFNPDERRVQDPTPCVFTSITPAWNNENLSRLACKIVSPLVFAHVRAAYPGMPVSEQNCHPFQFSRYMWMHNGVVGGFAQIRRSLLETLSDCAYNAVASFHSDSAVSFALFLNHLPDVRSQQPPDVLIKAMQDTIATISAVQRRHGITATSLLNYVVSDGTTLIATRFVSPESDGPASLYYAEGATFARAPPAPAPQPAPQPAQGPGQPGCTPCNGTANSGSSITQESSYELSFAAQGPAVVFVASEPITASASDWVAVPKNTALVVTREKGGFLNILRCPLVTQQPPAPSPTSTYLSPLSGGCTPPLPRRSSAGGTGSGMTGLVVTIPGGGGLPYIDPQRDVGLCLEALSRGLGTKSRAFLSHRPTGLGVAAGAQHQHLHQPGGLLPAAPESLATLDLPPSGASMVFSRVSAGGAEGLPATASMVQLPPAPGTATATPAASMMMPSRAGSQGLEVALASPEADTHDYMRLVGHTGAVLALTVCHYTARLYTSSVDCSVRVWSMRDNSCLHTLVGQRKPVTVMRLRAHGRLLLAASGRKIRVWDAVGFRCLQVIKISDSCGIIRCMEVLGAPQHHHRHHSHGHHAHPGQQPGASQPQHPQHGRAHGHANGHHAAGSAAQQQQQQRGMHHLYPQLTNAPAQPSAGRDAADGRSTASSDPAAAAAVLAGTSPSGAPAEQAAAAAAAASSARSSFTGSEVSGPLGLAMGGGYGSFTGGGEGYRYSSAGDGGSSSVSLAEGMMGSLQDLVLDGFGSVTPAVMAGSLSLRNEALLAGIATSAGRAAAAAGNAGNANGALGVSGGPGATAGGGARAAAAAAAAALMAAGGGAASAAAAEGLSLLYVGCQDTTVKVFTLNEPQLLAAAAAAAVEAVNAAANAARATAASSAAASRSDSLNASGLSSPPAKAPLPPATTPPASPFAPAARGTGGLAQALSRTTTTGVSGPPAVLPPRVIATPEEAEHGVSDLAPLMVTAADGGAHVGPVNCLAVCGRYLCSGGGDATVRVWDAATLKLVAVLRGHRGSVLCLLGLGPNLLLSGARDNTIRVWDLEMDMLCRRTLAGHKDDVTGLSAISLHKQRPGSLAHTHGHAHAHAHTHGGVAGTPPARGGGAPPPAAAAPSGTLTPGGRSVALASTVIASSSADGTVRLWSTAWACLCILSLPSSSRPVVPAALCGCLTPDMAMAGYGDGEVRLWHIEDVHGAVLQRCYNEVAAAAEALQAAACGCLAHGAAEAGGAGTAREQQLAAALVQVQQFGAAGAAAAAAALSGCGSEVLRRRSNAGSFTGGNGAPAGSAVQGALALLGGGVNTDKSAPLPAAPPVSEDDMPSFGGAPPAVPDPTGAPPLGAGALAAVPKSPMLTSPSLAHLVGSQSSNRPDSRASDASAASGQGTDRHSSVDLLPPTSSGMQRASSGGTSGGGAAPSATACAMAASVMAGPGTTFATPLPHAGAMPAAAVPIHIHGRRSPLSGASATSLGGAVSEGPGAAVAGCPAAAAAAAAAGAPALPPAPAAPLPVPPLMPSLATGPAAAAGTGTTSAAAAAVAAEAAAAAATASTAAALLGTATSYFTSTSDQQLEAALREFVRIKTVSSSPKLRDDCHKGAKFVAKMLEGLGADVKVVQVYEDKNPVVIGRLGHNPDRPTVTFYGHYDVQPAAEPDWATNPFELNSVNEYLYGRGVSDNKGPILAFIFAVRELMNAAAEAGAPGGTLLPVNVAFVFEGEEENGSRGFAQAITQNLRWFEGTQLIIISNTLWVGENVPCLTYGMRGMLSLTVQITGPERDLHSGNDGGVFAEPMVDLLRVMATMVGSGGRVQVPGFYEDVEPDLIELAWTSLEHSEEFSLEGYQAALGVPSLTAPPHKRDLLVTRWCRPSLSVVDMRPGAAHAAEPATTSYRFGPTRFSVIPKAAQGKVSVRFVPNQDADTLVEKLRQHVHKSFAALGSSNCIDLHVEARGNWWEVRRQGSPWLDMAEKAIAKEWGVHPLYVREGGTMPVASHLERLLCAPAIMIPMGQSSDNCHLANERIRRTNLFKGKNVIRRLLEEIGAMGGSGGAGCAGGAGMAAGGAASPCGGAGAAPVAAGEAAVGSRGGGPEASLGSMATAAAAGVVDNGETWGAPTACAGLDE
ncbi:hypothetical protein HXX76_000296 [Chlamydomonas incerta]|uniref:Glutamine amidotransferase type-2 domain-containing protein n=1 Tax=Chlamydomonas incerta TaxID=51695 RepID=A0A836B2Q8_CHLIN|nr:hypothetical protein HXX76_000296 [Chlamydomonas incerta]|eukprot:KAG2445688.1 hypothetical protein HXX76_000296 [Chlamydomonas incerta]